VLSVSDGIILQRSTLPQVLTVLKGLLQACPMHTPSSEERKAAAYQCGNKLRMNRILQVGLQITGKTIDCVGFALYHGPYMLVEQECGLDSSSDAVEILG